MGKGRLAEEPGGLNWEVLWLVVPMSLVFDQQCEIALAVSSFFPLPLFCILNIPHIQPHCSTVDILGMFRAACTQSLWANRFSGIPGFRQLCQSVFLIDLNERNKHVITPGGNVSAGFNQSSCLLPQVRNHTGVRGRAASGVLHEATSWPDTSGSTPGQSHLNAVTVTGKLGCLSLSIVTALLIRLLLFSWDLIFNLLFSLPMHHPSSDACL